MFRVLLPGFAWFFVHFHKLIRPHPGPLWGIVAKKWDPGNLVPSRFSGQIRKVEARLGKLTKIRKVDED